VRVDRLFHASPLRGVLTGIPDDSVAHRLRPIGAAGKEPNSGLTLEAAPVMPQRFQKSRAEHDIAVLATLAAAHVDHHALCVDIRNFESSEFGAPQARSIQSHQN